MIFFRKFKKLLPVLYLVSALFLIGCGSEPAAPTVVSVAQDFEAAELTNRVEVPEAGFSIVPPADY